jgi:biopolymer transport protein ExbD
VNVTPLIDVVMCLIIFFMLVTKVGISRGIDQDIRLPETILGGKIEDMGDTLTLNIHPPTVSRTADDWPQVTAQVNGETTVREIHPDELGRVLTAFRVVHKDKTKIILRADQDVLYMQLERVLISLHNANIVDTAYETKLSTATGESKP